MNKLINWVLIEKKCVVIKSANKVVFLNCQYNHLVGSGQHFKNNNEK